MFMIQNENDETDDDDDGEYGKEIEIRMYNWNSFYKASEWEGYTQ